MKRALPSAMIGCVLALALPATEAYAQGVIDFQTWLRYLNNTDWEGQCADIMADAIAGLKDLLRGPMGVGGSVFR